MADATIWMPLYVADYLADTQRLTTEHHGAYLLLIFDYWRNGPPPDDEAVLAQITKLDRAKWRKARPVLARMFQIENGVWRHSRIERELSRSGEISEKRKAAGKAGAAKRWDGKGIANAMAKPLANASQTQKQNDRQSQSQSQSQSQEEEVVGEIIPLPRRALAFSGRTIQLTRADFDEWRKRYSAIPDLAAELGALDDWLRTAPQAKRDNWFQVVSGALSRKHQQAVAEEKKDDGGEWEFTGPC